jgi:DNA-binding response OmpR family regulator
MNEPKRKALIYVFDDNDAIRMLLRIHLQQAGYEARAFEDAVEGGKALVEAPPDLLICDYEMPYMSGLDFIVAMKSDANLARVPTIMLTGRRDPDTEMAASNAGIACFLTKPVSRDDLLHAVEQVLSGKLVGRLPLT